MVNPVPLSPNRQASAPRRDVQPTAAAAEAPARQAATDPAARPVEPPPAAPPTLALQPTVRPVVSWVTMIDQANQFIRLRDMQGIDLEVAAQAVCLGLPTGGDAAWAAQFNDFLRTGRLAYQGRTAPATWPSFLEVNSATSRQAVIFLLQNVRAALQALGQDADVASRGASYGLLRITPPSPRPGRTLSYFTSRAGTWFIDPGLADAARAYATHTDFATMYDWASATDLVSIFPVYPLRARRILLRAAQAAARLALETLPSDTESWPPESPSHPA